MAGCQPEGALELARHVALIGKAAHDGCLDEGMTGNDRRFGTVEAAHGQVAIGAGPEPDAEMAGKRVAVEAGHGFQFLGCNGAHEVFVKEPARQINRPCRGRGGCPGGQRRVKGEERVGDRGDDLVAFERLERAVEIGKGPAKGVQQMGIRRDGAT